MSYVSSIPASYKWTVVSLGILKSHSLCVLKFHFLTTVDRSQWPHLRRGYGVARLLGLWFRIPPRSWMYVPCECCVLSGRGLCVGLITRPEGPYWVCPVSVIVIGRSWRELGLKRHRKITITVFFIDNAHLMYNAHPRLFRHSFWCIDNAPDAN
jgi:hypothetical protein